MNSVTSRISEIIPVPTKKFNPHPLKPINHSTWDQNNFTIRFKDLENQTNDTHIIVIFKIELLTMGGRIMQVAHRGTTNGIF